MLFAQVQIADPPSSAQLITVMLGVIFIAAIALLGLSIAEKIKQLFFTAPKATPVDEQYVTQKQFNDFKMEYKLSFDSMSTNITNKYEQLGQKMESVLIKLERLSTVQALFQQWHELRKQEESDDEK